MAPTLLAPTSCLGAEITYEIGSIYEHPDAEELKADLDRKVLTALRQCVAPPDELYALDWQHPSYVFRPHETSPTGFKAPVLPDGDYYIFLAPDFSFGLFGHPWEQTICVFGAPFLRALEEHPPRLFHQPIRYDGMNKRG